MDPTPPESCHGRNAAENVDRDDTIQHKMQDFDPVTVLDLQCLDLDKLGEVCKDWGLFRSVDHDVPVTLLNQLQDLARKLLSLSFESKQALFTSPNFLLLNHFLIGFMLEIKCLILSALLILSV